MLKICMVIQYYYPYIAGAEGQTATIGELIAQGRSDCTVVTSRFRNDLSARASRNGVVIRRLPSASHAGLKIVANAISAFCYFLINTRRFSVLHVHNLSPFSLGALAAAKLWRRPVLLTIGSLGADGDIAKILRIPLGKYIWRLFLMADLFVAQSPAALAEMRDHRVPEARIRLLPNALALKWTDAAAAHHQSLPSGLDAVSPVVLFAGRLTVEKGVRVLIEAWLQVVAETRGTLLLLGDGPERPWIEDRLRESGLQSTVLFLGLHEDPQPYFQAADLFAFASLSETFGNVLAEAMASGLAIVTTPVGLAKTWLTHERNALIAPPDATAFAGQLRRLLTNGALRERLGRAAREDAVTHFSARTILAGYMDLLKALADSAPVPTTGEISCPKT